MSINCIGRLPQSERYTRAVTLLNQMKSIEDTYNLVTKD